MKSERFIKRRKGGEEKGMKGRDAKLRRQK